MHDIVTKYKGEPHRLKGITLTPEDLEVAGIQKAITAYGYAWTENTWACKISTPGVEIHLIGPAFGLNNIRKIFTEVRVDSWRQVLELIVEHETNNNGNSN